MTDTIEVSAITAKGTGEPVITSLILKGTSGSANDRDAGFCSGGDEDDLEIEDEIHSPTDVSEDSVDVKVIPISSRNKNKRKCAEPRKVPNEDAPSGPLKKRIRFEMKQESESGRQSPFRPWNVSTRMPLENTPTGSIQSSPQPPSPPLSYHPVYGYQHPQFLTQEEPLSLVKSREEKQQQEEEEEELNVMNSLPDAYIKPKDFSKMSIKVESRVPPHPGVSAGSSHEMEELTKVPKTSPGFSVESLLSPKNQGPSMKHSQKDTKEQRNYKNMTRERRIEANARERTRVHTISAAFDTLRKAVPAYSHNQKLSKLSVLRIACSYILTLSRVAGKDYSADQSAPSLSSCVDLVSRTIQTEGKLRKKKEE